MYRWVIVSSLVMFAAVAAWILFIQYSAAPPAAIFATLPQSETNEIQQQPKASSLELVEPIAEFTQRITKKPFGIFITPETSPVQPDRFTGYHTGVDVEYGDVSGDVPIYAIADGTIVLRKFASGYGGVVVIEHAINGQKLHALYGHLDPKSMLDTNVTAVQAGDVIGVLGDGHTQETDGARKHLHFSIRPAGPPDIRGYVQTQEELAQWINPLELYP